MLEILDMYQAIDLIASRDIPFVEKLDLIDPTLGWSATHHDIMWRELLETHALPSKDALTTFPEFALPNENGGLTTEADLFSGKFVLIALERGTWCPFASLQCLELAKLSARIRNLNGQIATLVPDTQRFTRRFKTALGLPYPILSDIDLEVATGLGHRVSIHQKLISAFQADGIELGETQGSQTPALARPWIYLLSSDRKVLCTLSANNRPDAATLLAQIKTALA